MWLMLSGIVLSVISIISIAIMDIRWSIATVFRYNLSNKESSRLAVISSQHKKREATVVDGEFDYFGSVVQSKQNDEYSLSNIKTEQSTVIEMSGSDQAVKVNQQPVNDEQAEKTAVEFSPVFFEGEKAEELDEATVEDTPDNLVTSEFKTLFIAQQKGNSNLK